MHKVQGNPYLSGKEERLDSQFYGESDADTSSGPEDQVVETSGGSDSETTAGPNVASVLAEAPFLLMPLGTREDANTLAADSKTWPTVPCARPDMAPYPVRPTSAADQAAAFGVASQHLAEHADVAIRHPFPEFDTPVQSAAVDESAEPEFVSPRGCAADTHHRRDPVPNGLTTYTAPSFDLIRGQTANGSSNRSGDKSPQSDLPDKHQPRTTIIGE